MTPLSPAAAVVIPVKAFSAAKLRLAPVLDRPARAALARRLAGIVVAAAAPLPVLVVCDDDEVATWATGVGAAVVWSPGRGLDGAVLDGVASAAAAGATRAVVAHADLPLARDLVPLAQLDAALVLVPDRHRDGTNVVALPTGAGFAFGYGPGSFERHRARGLALGLSVRVVEDERLSWDVDVPEDLDHPDVALLLDRPPAACG